MRSAQGFTLIELLLVAVILSTISAFSFAGFSDISKIQTLKEAALNLESNFRFAHNQAISGVKPFSGCVNPINYRISLGASKGYNITACGRVVKVNYLPTNTSFKGYILYLNDGTTLPANNVILYFLPTGEIKFSVWLSKTSTIDVDAKSADIELIYGTDTTRSYVVNIQRSGGTAISKRSI